MTRAMSEPKPLLVLPTAPGIGELIRSIFVSFGQQVKLPREREAPVDALERAIGEVEGCLICCDHPATVLDELRRRAMKAFVPIVLFSSRKRADDVSRAARRLELPWIDLTEDPHTIVGSVRRAVEGTPETNTP